MTSLHSSSSPMSVASRCFISLAASGAGYETPLWGKRHYVLLANVMTITSSGLMF